MFPCVPRLRSTAGPSKLFRRMYLSKSFLSQKPSSILFVLPTHFMCNLAHLVPIIYKPIPYLLAHFGFGPSFVLKYLTQTSFPNVQHCHIPNKDPNALDFGKSLRSSVGKNPLVPFAADDMGRLRIKANERLHDAGILVLGSRLANTPKIYGAPAQRINSLTLGRTC